MRDFFDSHCRGGEIIQSFMTIELSKDAHPSNITNKYLVR